MKIITAYRNGWKKVWQNKKMWILLYLLNFVIALLAAIPFSGFLSKTVGHTLANTKMVNGFDYAFLTDFVREHGGGFSVILNLSFGIIFLYFLFQIFWMGGILKILKKENSPFSIQRFLRGSAFYFWRLVRLTFYFILIQIVILAIFVFIFVQLGFSPFEMESEVQVINSLKTLIPIYLLFATLIFMIQDYSKVHMIHNKKFILTSSIRNAIRFVFKNFKNCFGLYLLNLLTFLVFFGIYWLLSNSFKSDTTPTIGLLFLVGQAFIFARIAVKLLNLGSAISFFQNETK